MTTPVPPSPDQPTASASVDHPSTQPPTPTPPPAKRRRRPLRPWQYILIGAAIPVVLLIAAALLIPLLFRAMMGDQPQGMGEAEYTVQRIELGQVGVTLPGTIEPTQRLDLSFASRGEVTHVGVAVGDSVTPGAVLATIDDTDLRAAVTDARAETDAAWKDYQDARRSGQSAAVSAMRSAHAVKAQALKEAEEALEKASLTSTIDGVVAAVNVQAGQVAGESAGPDAAGAPGEPGQADVVVIARTFQVKASVGSSERSRLSKGMEALVTSPSSPEPLRGTVTALGVVAEASTEGERPGAATFPLVVTLEGQPENVFAGSSATIELLPGGDGGGPVLAIPVDALQDRISPTEGMVLVRRGADPAPTTVQLGTESGGMVEVTDGLAEGDVVVFFPPMGPAGPDGPMGPGAAVAAAPTEEPKR